MEAERQCFLHQHQTIQLSNPLQSAGFYWEEGVRKLRMYAEKDHEMKDKGDSEMS